MTYSYRLIGTSTEGIAVTAAGLHKVARKLGPAATSYEFSMNRGGPWKPLVGVLSSADSDEPADGTLCDPNHAAGATGRDPRLETADQPSNPPRFDVSLHVRSVVEASTPQEKGWALAHLFNAMGEAGESVSPDDLLEEIAEARRAHRIRMWRKAVRNSLLLVLGILGFVFTVFVLAHLRSQLTSPMAWVAFFAVLGLWKLVHGTILRDLEP